MAHNPETLRGTHKKNGTLLETSLLKNCGKLSSLSRKNWGCLYQKSSNCKAYNCCQQRSIIRPIRISQRIKQGVLVGT